METKNTKRTNRMDFTNTNITFRPCNNYTRDRVKSDRRRNGFTLSSLKYLFVGNRKSSRRKTEITNYYVDQYNSYEITLICTLLFLNLLDVLFTFVHLENGASEANPFLNFFYVNFGFSALFLVKALIVAPALFFLLVHIKFIRAKKGIWLLLGTYVILNIYHVAGLFLLS